MKKLNIYASFRASVVSLSLLTAFCCTFTSATAQHAVVSDSTAGKTTTGTDTIAQTSTSADSTTAPVAKKRPYVRNTFEGNYIIDNQTVMVPIKGTFEFDIQHRFGTVKNGSADLFGLFAGANMRLAASYVPLNDLQVGLGASNEYMQVDVNVKYAILKETKDGSMPVSITYYGNAAADTRKKDATTLFVTTSDRFSYFNQIIIARKVSEKLSVQVSPTYSHFNNLEGYFDVSGNVLPKLKNDNFSVAVAGRYKISDESAIIVNYDQPLTQNPLDNPRPNISFGIEMKTSGHDFEIFFGNYGSVEPQYNNFFNQNDYKKGEFLLGFNITRLWNF